MPLSLLQQATSLSDNRTVTRWQLVPVLLLLPYYSTSSSSVSSSVLILMPFLHTTTTMKVQSDDVTRP
jgi:hypothetical protein